MMRKRLIPLILVVLTVVLLTSCTSSSTTGAGMPAANGTFQPPADGTLQASQSVSETAEASATEEPTSTSTATATVTATPTATPEGRVLLDDFTDGISSAWSWVNENADNWTITEDGYLQITGQTDTLTTTGTQENLLCTDLPDGDFSVLTDVYASPLANFQQASIYIYQDAENYLAFSRGFCDLTSCKTSGDGIFMQYKMYGTSGLVTWPSNSPNMYMKISRSGSQYATYFTTYPDQWQRLGRIGDVFTDAKICLGVGNGAETDTNLAGKFNYVEITQP